MADKAASTSTTGASSSTTADKTTEKTVLALLEEDDEFQVSVQRNIDHIFVHFASFQKHLDRLSLYYITFFFCGCFSTCV